MEIPKKEGGLGTIRIVDDVVETIAAMAASEVEGVAGQGIGIANDIANMFTGGKQKSAAKGKGVRVEVDEQEATVDLYLAVEYGYSLVEVATKVQNAVKDALGVMTGLTVQEVNVHVQGLYFRQSEPKEKETI